MNVRFGSVIELLFFVCVAVESAEQSDQLKQSLKEEKQTRKKMESKVDHIEEELNDLRHEKESLERVRALSDTRQNCFSGICQYTDYTQVSLSTWFCFCTLQLAPLFIQSEIKTKTNFASFLRILSRLASATCISSFDWFILNCLFPS